LQRQVHLIARWLARFRILNAGRTFTVAIGIDYKGLLNERIIRASAGSARDVRWSW